MMRLSRYPSLQATATHQNHQPIRADQVVRNHTGGQREMAAFVAVLPTHPGALSIAKFSRDASRQHLREHAGIEPTLDQVSLQSLTHRRRLDIMPELNRYAVWK
jgi:hypothetical protein